MTLRELIASVKDAGAKVLDNLSDVKDVFSPSEENTTEIGDIICLPVDLTGKVIEDEFNGKKFHYITCEKIRGGEVLPHKFYVRNFAIGVQPYQTLPSGLIAKSGAAIKTTGAPADQFRKGRNKVADCYDYLKGSATVTDGIFKIKCTNKQPVTTAAIEGNHLSSTKTRIVNVYSWEYVD